MPKKIISLLLTTIIITLIGLYFAVKSPITHMGFSVVIDSQTTNQTASLKSISPNGSVSTIKGKTENNQIVFAFGDKKNHLRNVAYFVLNTDIATLNSVSVYKNNGSLNNKNLIASYSKEEFLKAWQKTDNAYKNPANIRIAKSLLPKIDKVINWRGDHYLVLVVILFYLVCAILWLAIYYLKNNLEQVRPIIANIKNYYVANKNNLIKYFIINYLIITLCYIGIAFVNRPFADDFARLNDKNGWLHDGRYLVHFIYQFFTMHLSRAIYVASPYTYFLSTAFLSLASVILALFYNKKNIYISLAISTLLAIAPFYWEAILFRHEVLIMSVSVAYIILFSLFSVQITHFKSSLAFNFLGLFIVFFCYQMVVLNYILLLAFYFIYQITINKQPYEIPFNRVLSGGVALGLSGVFFKIVDKFFLYMDKINYAQKTSSIESLNLDYIFSRLHTIFSMLINDWQNTSFGVATMLVLLLFIGLISYRLVKAKLPKLAILLLIVALVVMFISPFLIYILTAITLYNRYFVAINLLISLALLFVYNQSKYKYLHQLSLALVICLVLSCFAMASFLANRLQHQQEYEVQISTFLQDDLYQYKKNYGTTNNVYFKNPQNTIKIFEDKSQKPLFMVMYNLLRQGTPFNIIKLAGDKTSFLKNTRDDFSKESFIVVADRVYYNFYYYPNLKKAIVDFK